MLHQVLPNSLLITQIIRWLQTRLARKQSATPNFGNLYYQGWTLQGEYHLFWTRIIDRRTILISGALGPLPRARPVATGPWVPPPTHFSLLIMIIVTHHIHHSNTQLELYSYISAVRSQNVVSCGYLILWPPAATLFSFKEIVKQMLSFYEKKWCTDIISSIGTIKVFSSWNNGQMRLHGWNESSRCVWVPWKNQMNN